MGPYIDIYVHHYMMLEGVMILPKIIFLLSDKKKRKEKKQ